MITPDRQIQDVITDELVALLSRFDPELIDAMRDHGAYTKKGRLNLSALGRILGLAPEKVKRRLLALRQHRQIFFGDE